MAALVANSIILRVEIRGFCASALSHIVQRHSVQFICATKVEVKPDDVVLIEITLKDRCFAIVSHSFQVSNTNYNCQVWHLYNCHYGCFPVHWPSAALTKCPLHVFIQQLFP